MIDPAIAHVLKIIALIFFMAMLLVFCVLVGLVISESVATGPDIDEKVSQIREFLNQQRRDLF